MGGRASGAWGKCALQGRTDVKVPRSLRVCLDRHVLEIAVAHSNQVATRVHFLQFQKEQTESAAATSGEEHGHFLDDVVCIRNRVPHLQTMTWGNSIVFTDYLPPVIVTASLVRIIFGYCHPLCTSSMIYTPYEQRASTRYVVTCFCC